MVVYLVGSERTGHSAEELAALGLLSFSGAQGSPRTGERLEGRTEAAAKQSLHSLVQLGPGLPAVPKKLLDRISAGEYVDFMELPPARGRTRPAAHALGEGQIVVVQAADLAPARKLVPDLPTWLQCFAIFTAAVLQDHPERVTELMAYQTIIAKASQRYKWPSWAIYDATFRQEMAGTSGQSWARVEPSIYSLCFTGQAMGSENWCSTCQTLDHTPQTCPARPRKRPWNAAFGGQTSPQPSSSRSEACRRYNRFAGDCRFGRDCKYRHCCSSCGGTHPASRCKTSERPARDSSGNQ